MWRWKFESSNVVITYNNHIVTKVSSLTSNSISSYKYLPTNDTSITSYTPTYDYHPATKKYVDQQVSSGGGYMQTIGDGTSKSFVITHNLNTLNVIVQCRLVGTLEQVLVSNKIIDSNTIQLDFNSTPATNSINVYVK